MNVDAPEPKSFVVSGKEPPGPFFSRFFGTLDPEPDNGNDTSRAHQLLPQLGLRRWILASRGNSQELKTTGRTLQIARCPPQKTRATATRLHAEDFSSCFPVCISSASKTAAADK